MSLSDPDCVRLLQWACPRLGLEWSGFRRVRGQVCKRIARRMAVLHLSCEAEYRERLEQVPSEWAELDAACRVTISRFYRDRAVFDALREQLPMLARRALEVHRSLHCWSAGCCSGEEPYTLALILQLGLPPALHGVPFEILATDSNSYLLERARRACYPPGALDELPHAWRAEAFRRESDELCLLPAYRERIQWAEQDLRRVLPEGPFDLILCRNVAFSYFGPRLQEETASKLHARLVAGGVLIIGGHERLPAGSTGFEQEGHLPLYRKQ